MIEESLEAKILDWIAMGDTGLSSKTIALWVSRRKTLAKWGRPATPADPADLGRCLRLLRAIPELRKRLPEMADCSDQWAHMLTYWDEIEQSMIDEVGIDWEKGGRAQRTYELMQAKEASHA